MSFSFALVEFVANFLCAWFRVVASMVHGKGVAFVGMRLFGSVKK